MGHLGGKFDYIVLICPTFLHNKTSDGFSETDDRLFVCIPKQDAVDALLRSLTTLFEMIALPLKTRRTSQLVNLAFSARHFGISCWLVTQQFTSIAKPFRENIGVWSCSTPLQRKIWGLYSRATPANFRRLKSENSSTA